MSAKDIAEELASFPVYSMTDRGLSIGFAKKAKKVSQAYLDLLGDKAKAKKAYVALTNSREVIDDVENISYIATDEIMTAFDQFFDPREGDNG